MKVRPCLLLLPVAICCAEAAEPKARPRLPPVVGEVKREAAQPARDAGSGPGFRSLGDFLQAESRRAIGLELFREPPGARSEAGGAEKSGQVSKDSLSTLARTDAGDTEILVLPKIEITAERLTKLGAQIAALEAQQSWQESSAEAWETRTETSKVVDAILNPPFLRLGGYSASGRAAVARLRVEMARWVRILVISLEEAKTPADKARIQADINTLNDITRYWE